MNVDRAKAFWTRASLYLRVFHQLFQLFAVIVEVAAAFGVLTFIIGVVERDAQGLVTGTLVLVVAAAVMLMARRAVVMATGRLTDVFWETQELVYELPATGNRYRFSCTILVQALRDGVDGVADKYRWSGTGTEAFKVTSPAHKLEWGPVLRHTMFYYRIAFGRSLHAGEHETVVSEQILDDDKGTHEPLLSKVVTETIGTLILRIVFPQGIRPVYITRHEYSTGSLLNELSSAVHSFDEARHQIIWKIPSPIFGHMYALRWVHPVPPA